MSKYFRKLATSMALVGALATGGCMDDNNNLPGEQDASIADVVQCNIEESYNLKLALTDYNTGDSIQNAIVRAEWNENEGKVCTFDNESKFYACNDVPGDLSLGISLDGISEIYNSPIDTCGEQSQIKEYWFNAPVSINPGLDAGVTGDVSDAGVTGDVSDAGVTGDVSDAGVTGDVSDADFDDSGSDVGLDSDAGLGDAGDLDAAVIFSCANLNEFPGCMDNYTTLVATASEHNASINLGYQNITQNFADLANVVKKVVSGNACNLGDYFQQPGACTDGLVQGQALVNLIDDGTVEVKGFLFQERIVALDKLVNGELNGTSCTVTVDPQNPEDPNTAQVNCQ
jgi:hypothetical protein